MLPNSGITTTLVGNALGVSTHNIGELHRNARVNKWSFMKPLAISKNVITDSERRLNSGFVSSEVSTSWGTKIKVFNYVVPTSYYRLGDFRGYNHNASVPKAAVEKRSWTDTPPGTDVRIGETDSNAQFNVKVTLPEIPIWLFNHPENTGVITINFGVFGSSDFKEEVGKLDVAAACNNNPDTYLAQYANKTINIPCTQTRNLPSRGYSVTYKYYALISNSYIESMDFLSFNANLHRVKVLNPNYPEDYDYRIPISWFAPASPTTVPYTKIGNLDYNGYSYIRIENIRNLMTGNDLVIKYRTRNKPFTTAVTLTIGNEWQTARDVAWHISPTNGGSGWTLVFKRPIGTNDAITEIAIAGERSIG